MQTGFQSPMLAARYDERDPTGFFLSEKFDGFRAVWNGEKLLSRSGKTFSAPAWFTRDLPRGVVLDGELWAGRGNFAEMFYAVRGGGFAGVTFQVFDVVSALPFAARRAAVQALELPTHARAVEHVPCSGPAALRSFFDGITGGGGEGVMLRDPAALYVHDRTDTLLKLKPVDEARAAD